ncbi:glycoside hydrolase family 16 protein [Lentinula raphanica]|uniref:Glycoside hydrolase family 16 protein n=1 Tax=Lentinula raphanica TaxID=153919 RepID=A0AA38PK61_9AGAR|nr:glycoside hydrolase family 16 protein [Lentinula raphanica]KAJ3844448.1 glycoside hydrolase family 16 protein [Lentinula raphanica]KAJ3978016.1 glycoside hydrolase family 16 protein [Lentinula raphanica]
MHFISTAVLLSLPLSSLAVHQTRSFGQQHRRAAHKARDTTTSNSTYVLEDLYQGQSFFNSSLWTFFDDTDPTAGLVNYQSSADAQSKGLAYVQDDGTTVLKVDNTTSLTSGQYRDSVRIGSVKSYNGGLFIASFYAMPWGCATWPAFWTVGPNWPDQGEIDIIEGVNLNTHNQLTLHSGSGSACTIESSFSSLISANSTIGNLQCASSDTSNTGCTYIDNDPRSYGQGFNAQGGGVYAMDWNSDAIKMWFFPRSDIPSDIINKTPNPSSWGNPAALFSNTGCDISSHFSEHTITINTDVCGGWTESSFSGSGCSGTCADTVADPSNFDNAQWQIEYVAVYQS